MGSSDLSKNPYAQAALIGSQTAGGYLQGRASNNIQKVPNDRPTALFPGLQDSYLSSLTQAGVPAASFGTLSDIAKTGLPTNFSDAFSTLKASFGRLQDEGRANLKEKFGVVGGRFGSGYGNAAVDYENQSTKDFASILAEYTRQATEAAANRRLQAASAGASFASEPSLAFFPTSTLVTGGQSAVGSGLQAGGNALLQYVLLRSIMQNNQKTGT